MFGVFTIVKIPHLKDVGCLINFVYSRVNKTFDQIKKYWLRRYRVLFGTEQVQVGTKIPCFGPKTCPYAFKFHTQVKENDIYKLSCLIQFKLTSKIR